MNIYNLAHPSVRAFKEFLKVVAENNLWDELEAHLHARGCEQILMSAEPIQAAQELLRDKLAEGPKLTLTPPGQVVILSSGCMPRPAMPPTPEPKGPGDAPGGPPPGPPVPQRGK